MATEITVRGSYTSFQQPERATVVATLAYEGAQLQPAFDRIVCDLEAVKTSLEPLHDPERGPVTWWSTQEVRTWSHRPFNKDGRQLPLVHHAAVGLQVKFRDYTALSRWIGEHTAATDGFRVDQVRWALTEVRNQALTREVRERAVQDAAVRAQAYADALGLGPISPVAIADAGMLGHGTEPTSGSEVMYSRAARGKAPGQGPELDLIPEDIEVSVHVDARFTSGSPTGEAG